jgi:hypothetical protein
MANGLTKFSSGCPATISQNVFKIDSDLTISSVVEICPVYLILNLSDWSIISVLSAEDPALHRIIIKRNLTKMTY